MNWFLWSLRSEHLVNLFIQVNLLSPHLSNDVIDEDDVVKADQEGSISNSEAVEKSHVVLNQWVTDVLPMTWLIRVGNGNILTKSGSPLNI